MSKEKKKINLKENKVVDFIKENKKQVAIGGGILIGAILLVVLIISFGGSNKNVLEGIFASEKPIVISKDGKYGYITSDGEDLIEPQFLTAGDFYFDHALVSKLNEENRTIYQIIDKKGTVVMEVDNTYEPEYIEETAVWLIDSKLYDKDMKLIYESESYVTYIDYGYFSYMSNDGKESGIIDSTGKKVFKWNEDYITVDISSTTHEEEGYYAAVSNYEESEIVVNLTNGKTIFTLEKPKDQYIQVEDNNVFRIIDRSDSYKTVKWMYFRDDKMVFDIDESIYAVDLINYEDKILRFNYGADYQDLGKKTAFEYFSIEEDKIIEKYENTSKLVEVEEMMKERYDYVITNCDGDLQGIDKGDKNVLACEYSAVDFLNIDLYEYILESENKNLVLLEKEESTILYDLKRDKEVKTFASTSVKNDSRSTFLTVTLYEENGYTKKGFVIYNILTDKELEIDKSADIEVRSNYIKVTLDEKTTYYNAKLESIYEE